jgi:L-seryl-tRNA(Ser) seleniumtransferase
MGLQLNWNRRGFLGTTAAVAASIFAPGKLWSGAGKGNASPAVTGFGQTGNPYDELGVPTVINCEGTMTMLGGSILRPELEAVMAMAGRHFVSIPRRASAYRRC